MDKQVLTKLDIITIIKYLIELINSKAEIDDIDHLSNRRVRTVGEQLSSQFGVGLARMARTIRERMNVRDNEVFTPIDLDQRENTFFRNQQFLWNQPVVSVYGSNQSTGRDYAQTTISALRTWRTLQRTCWI